MMKLESGAVQHACYGRWSCKERKRDSAQFRHFVRIQVQHIAGQRDPTRIRDSQTATSLLPLPILGTTRHTCEIPATQANTCVYLTQQVRNRLTTCNQASQGTSAEMVWVSHEEKTVRDFNIPRICVSWVVAGSCMRHATEEHRMDARSLQR